MSPVAGTRLGASTTWRADSSHLGLGHHPATVVVVADRLAQDLDRWSPFEPPRLAARLFPAG